MKCDSDVIPPGSLTFFYDKELIYFIIFKVFSANFSTIRVNALDMALFSIMTTMTFARTSFCLTKC